jgi:hypothetical protein
VQDVKCKATQKRRGGRGRSRHERQTPLIAADIGYVHCLNMQDWLKRWVFEAYCECPCVSEALEGAPPPSCCVFQRVYEGGQRGGQEGAAYKIRVSDFSVEIHQYPVSTYRYSEDTSKYHHECR